MNGAQVAVGALEREGVDFIFGYPGGTIMPLYDALFNHAVRHVLCRHEAAAVQFNRRTLSRQHECQPVLAQEHRLDALPIGKDMCLGICGDLMP